MDYINNEGGSVCYSHQTPRLSVVFLSVRAGDFVLTRANEGKWRWHWLPIYNIVRRDYPELPQFPGYIVVGFCPERARMMLVKKEFLK